MASARASPTQSPHRPLAISKRIRKPCFGFLLLVSLLVSPCQAFLSAVRCGRGVQPASHSADCSLSLAHPNNAPTTNLTLSDNISALKTQAESLKAQVRAMELALKESRRAKVQKEQTNVERWMEDLLVNVTIDESTQILNSVDQVAIVLQDGRYSPEQVNKMFRKLTAGIPKERIEQSLVDTPLLQLLVDACGRVDQLEREENANKRWNHRVERDLRKKLFALEWGIDLRLDSDSDQ